VGADVDVDVVKEAAKEPKEGKPRLLPKEDDRKLERRIEEGEAPETEA
jgi:hypothetical protein